MSGSLVLCIGGLVQQKKRPVARQHGQQSQPPLLPLTQFIGGVLAPGQQVKFLQQCPGLLAQGLLLCFGLQCPQGGQNLILHGQAQKLEPGILEHQPRSAVYFQAALAASGPGKAGEQGGFAAAVSPHQRGDAASGKVKTQMLGHRGFALQQPQVFCLHHGFLRLGQRCGRLTLQPAVVHKQAAFPEQLPVGLQLLWKNAFRQKVAGFVHQQNAA